MTKAKGGMTGPVSRRQFLGAAGAAGLGSALLASGLRGAVPAPGGQAKPKDAPKAKAALSALPLRPFGRTGVQVTALAQGGMTDFTENQILLGQGLKDGINYWDTAAGYNGGKSEEGYGQYFAKHPGVRKRIFLVTKCGDVSPDGLTASLDRSLKRMKTDWVDLLFFHGMDDLGAVDRPEIKAWAEQAKQAKKIRFIGLSCHKNMATVLTASAQLGWIDAIMLTYNFRIMHDDDMKQAVDACVAAKVGLTAMKTQGGGPINDTAADRELAGRLVAKGFTPEQAKIKAVLEDTRIASVCSQMPTIEILKSNVAAVLDRTKLDAADWKALDRHAAATCHGTCAACGRCERALKGSVPVADVMRHLMYARGYGEHAMARAFVRELPAVVRGRMVSGDFARVERACPNGLPISRLMKEAILELA